MICSTAAKMTHEKLLEEESSKEQEEVLIKEVTQDAKKHIISAAENGDDWRAVAKANGVPTATAYGWIRRSDEPPKRRGGAMSVKIFPRHMEKCYHM